MPSHLTRVVFRSIIANEPLLYRGCRQRALRSPATAQHGARVVVLSPRRTFFGGLFKAERKIKKMDIPAGLETMSSLTHAQRMSERPPEAKDLAEAFKSFFVTKKGPLENFHIELVHNTFEYLLEHPREGGAPWFSRKELFALVDELLSVRRRPETGGTPHVAFGTALIDQIVEMPKDGVVEGTGTATESANVSREEEIHFSIRPTLITLLCVYGAVSKAKSLATEHYKYVQEKNAKRRKVARDVWNCVLMGAVRENATSELAELTELFTNGSLPLSRAAHSTIVSTLAGRQELEAAKFWYSQPVFSHRNNQKTIRAWNTAHAAMLKACALSGDLTFGHEVVARLTEGDVLEKYGWDAIFVWSAAIGKGADEIERMMSVMERRNKKLEVPVYPDIDTINLLVDFAMSKQDPYSAERYIAMGQKQGIMPDEQTYTMQVQYRLSVKDVDGAKAAYYNLQGDFKGSEASVAAVNQLIQALCESKQEYYDEIMAIVDDLHERKARFAPETVAKLCILHLRRVEIHDAMDLLQVHVFQYSPEQRAVVAKSLSEFILDGKNSTADAWDAYQILRNTFPETPRDTRVRVMKEFFSRKRSDMACHVFFHMRNHTVETHQANRDVYIAAFTGFARCADADSLELVNNQLKLDFRIEMNTMLRNALMLAHASCGSNKKALEIWREICESREGPSYNSIAIAFRSTEGMPWGDSHAKSIWARLQQQDVEIDRKIFIAYQSAIARNHLHDEALELVETAQDEYGHKPDFDMLSNWYNTTTNIEKQRQVKAWIMERYPGVWTEMEKRGFWTTMEGFGYQQCNIDRHLEP